MKHALEISSDVFAVPVGEYLQKRSEDLYLLFAPLAGKSTIVTRDLVPRIEEIFRRDDGSADETLRRCAEMFGARSAVPALPETPDDYPSLIVLPTAKCNFRCKYCFAAQARSGLSLSRDRLLAVLGRFCGRPRERYTVLFSGGGEPLLELPLIESAAAFLEKHVPKEKLCIKINTNGSLIDRETTGFFKEHSVKVTVSFDVLESLQNVDRGSYRRVRGNILLMMENGVIPSIISTLTPQSAPFFPQMAEELRDAYPEIRHWTAEMATLPELPAESFGRFHSSWLAGYFAAGRIFTGEGRTLNCSLSRIMEDPTRRRCHGHWVVTPSGTFSICPLTSAEQDLLWEKNTYGCVDENGEIRFQPAKFHDIIHDTDTSRPPCRSCFMKWNCAGGCRHQNNVYPSAVKKQYCELTREFAVRFLLETIEGQVRRDSGKSLKEFFAEI